MLDNGPDYFPPVSVSNSFSEKLSSFLLRRGLVWVTNIFRLTGVLTLPAGKIRVAIVSRFYDTKEILTRSDAFQTPYGELAEYAGWGPSFLLAVKEIDKDYWSIRESMEQLWLRSDIGRLNAFISAQSEHLIAEAIAEKNAEMDLAKGFTHRLVPLMFTNYFGIDLTEEERQQMLGASIVLGGYVFGMQGTPDANDKNIEHVRAAHARIKQLVLRTLEKDGPSLASDAFPETAVDRARKAGLVGSKASPESLRRFTDIFMDAIIGCATPTVSGAGKMIDYLLHSDHEMLIAQSYARNPEKDFVKCVRECLRLSYIVPALWRKVDADTAMNEPSFFRRRIKANTYVFMAMQSALTDPRRFADPNTFDPERDTSNTIIFGHLAHNCIGGYLAENTIASMFTPLLQKNVQAKGSTQWQGLIPVHTQVAISE